MSEPHIVSEGDGVKWCRSCNRPKCVCKEMPKTKTGKLKKKFRDRFAHMANWIEKSYMNKDKNKHYFDYPDWLSMDQPHVTLQEAVEHPCGMAGCIGGWSAIFAAIEKGYKGLVKIGSRLHATKEVSGLSLGVDPLSLFNDDVAREYLGVNWTEGDYLFFGRFDCRGTRTPDDQVVKKLRQIAKTGKIIDPEFDEANFSWPEYLKYKIVRSEDDYA